MAAKKTEKKKAPRISDAEWIEIESNKKAFDALSDQLGYNKEQKLAKQESTIRYLRSVFEPEEAAATGDNESPEKEEDKK